MEFNETYLKLFQWKNQIYALYYNAAYAQLFCPARGL